MERGITEEASVEAPERHRSGHHSSGDGHTNTYQRTRTIFFVGAALAGYTIALVFLGIGVLLDARQIPFSRWSLIFYLIGGFATALVGQGAAKIYRTYRRKLSRG